MAETAESIRADALKELERWNAIRKNGSNDPFWPDGVNLNLVRNHIIYANRRLKELSSAPVQLSMFSDCERLIDDGSVDLVPLPPEAPNDFMARKGEILQGARKALSILGNSKSMNQSGRSADLRQDRCRFVLSWRRPPLRDSFLYQAWGGGRDRSARLRNRS